MKTIETTNVIPVDLQALLCWNARILKYFAEIIGDNDGKAKFGETEEEIRRTVNVLLYNKTEKAWLDYNIRDKSHNTLYYLATAMPLFTKCHAELDIDISNKFIEFMNRFHVLEYPNGVPTSLNNTGQQWDLPNGWPPLQHIVIEGMRKSDNPEAQNLAFKLARKWVLANYKVFKKTSKMWEKIDVTGTVPKPGKGGEYNVQDGFGWTNGVILDLLSTYYDSIKVEETDDKFPSQVTTSKIESPKNKSSKITSFRIKDSKKIALETKAPQVACGRLGSVGKDGFGDIAANIKCQCW
uniref:Trehalase n=1 Tax=Setaria digitata TaxID=48799 RepID=A0A915PKZ4_9BILA